MSTPLNRAASAAVALVVVLGLASASCTHSDDSQVAAAGDGVARSLAAADSAVSLYPPIQKDAGDGHVHEYY